jgi:hypothetical protein
MHWYVMANIVLAALVVGVIVGLLVWSVLTQHRHPGCEDVRIRRRRLQISVRLVPRTDQRAPGSTRADVSSVAAES